MKKLLLLLFFATFFISCNNDSSSTITPMGETPLAKAEFDTSNFGIYKGVVIGSSGVITINVKNDGNLNATLVLDGVSSTFTCVENVTMNEAVTDLTFKSGNMTFDVNLSANGDDISVVSSSIPNHENAVFNIIKEYSYDIVKCYEGTYVGTDQGVFNLIVIDDFVTGLSKSNVVKSDAYYLSGSLSTNAISGSIDSDTGTFVGTLSGNSVSGTWNVGETSGTWTGTRTL